MGASAAVAVAAGVVMLLPPPGRDAGDAPAVAALAPDVVTDVATAPAVATDAPVLVAGKFENFRMAPDGFGTVAGRAQPGMTVDVLVAGDVVESVVADASGAFGAALFLEPSDAARAVWLVFDPEGAATPSQERFFVQPSVVAAAPDAVAAADTGTMAPTIASDQEGAPQAADVSADVPVVTTAQDPVAAPVEAAVLPNAVPDAAPDTAPDAVTSLPELGAPASPVADAAAPAQNAAPAVLVADADGVRVVQPPAGDLAPEVVSNIALDSITYDDLGDVLLAGRALGAGFVQVYLNNQPIITSRIDAQGDWQTDLPDVDTGVYTLRIDEVTDAGEVVSRIETPFKREEPAAVAAVFAEETGKTNFQVAVRTVQPGSTLWAIAREEFGEGVMYVAVFEANKDLIRDPDLIYPGQVFRMPEIPQTPGE